MLRGAVFSWTHCINDRLLIIWCLLLFRYRSAVGWMPENGISVVAYFCRLANISQYTAFIKFYFHVGMYSSCSVADMYRIYCWYSSSTRRPEKRHTDTDTDTSLKLTQLEMWANAQRDGRPAEYRWRPVFNAAKFGWRPLLQCRAVTLPRRETRWNLQGCLKLTKRSQPLVGRSSPYYGNTWRRYCCLTGFFQLSMHTLVAKI